MHNRILLGLAALGLSLSAPAQTLTNVADGYSLDFPAGWFIPADAGSFSARHADGSSLDAMSANLPPNIKSVEVAALMIHAAALAAGYCDGKPATEFDVAGEGWTGKGFHCNNRSSSEAPVSETIGVVVKHGGAFHQFMMFVPRQDWPTRGEQYLALFKSLRFRV